MTHISRPLQIALVAIALFVAVWFVALRGHSATEGSRSVGSSAAPAAAPHQAPGSASSSASSGSSGASPGSSTYHGSAPGIGGLTRAIAKARGAVARSQQEQDRLQRKSVQAASSDSTQSSKSGSPSAAHAKPAPSAGAKADLSAPAARTHATHAIPAMQAKVEAQLGHGKVVAILFWNPNSSVDAIVQRELHAAGHKLRGGLAVDVARASGVGSFGSFTHTVHVYGTPTILMINTKGVASTVSGLTDAFSIAQAVREVKRAR